ncbi:hypothetical protein [Pseudopelagicola sp. nBUS_19]|uniref:hypothetical protein n=1 Tax=Pseudopelagicola sp. nBUS_19 TaxID=3395316 RepID=UPI003EBA4C1A
MEKWLDAIDHYDFRYRRLNRRKTRDRDCWQKSELTGFLSQNGDKNNKQCGGAFSVLRIKYDSSRMD